MSKGKGRKLGPMKQPMISSFFQASSPAKRPSSPIVIDLTDSEDEAKRPTKKQRTQANLFLPGTPSPPPERAAEPTTPVRSSGGAAEQWRFNPATPGESPVQPERSVEEQDARKKRRQQFAKKLLKDNSAFIRKPRESEAESDVMEVDGAGAAEGGSDASESESDDKFKELEEMFSHKAGKKGKGKAKAVKAAPKRTKKPPEELGPSGLPYTALEQQVRSLKQKHPGILLMVEVGYKIRFFGEDAKVAGKELGIVCYPDRNFDTASIPVHRRDIHLKKLLSKGYKVGIVEQTETAALKKVGDNRNAPFERVLTHLYTAATFVDELDSVDDVDRSAPLLMCLVEELRGGMGVDEKVAIGMIVLCPSTGEVTWDHFEDGHMRTELETRMIHTKPAELLLPQTKLSKPTERMLAHFAGNSTFEHNIRIERYKTQMPYTEAFESLSEFYTRKTQAPNASESFTSGRLMATITDFPHPVTVALAQCIKYLSAFGIEDALLATRFFSVFTTKAHMILNGNTLTNLEIYQNDTDYTKRGSLMWILDRTRTKFGSRLLRNWVGKPLVDMRLLQERIDAVEEIVESPAIPLVRMRDLLKGLPDLAKGLCRIQYGKCTSKELAILLPAFNKVATTFSEFGDNPSDVGFKSPILNDIFFALPKLREPIQSVIADIFLKHASEGNMDLLWIDSEKYPKVADAKSSIQHNELELDGELKSIRRILKRPSLQWTTVAGEEYLIEVSRADDRIVPIDWNVISSTKKVRRYRPPKVKEKVEERHRLQEILQAEARAAYLSFLEEITQNHYAILRDTVNKLAIIDCLDSLAQVAASQGYVKPAFTEIDKLHIVGGRHPMVEALLSDPFISNDIRMGGVDHSRSKIITGPNMGGKSSAVRMVALIAIMAQVGSYVPATEVTLSLSDGVLTRMGASDELARGRSTFMVEMSETSDILLNATSKSLVILDELGRGTSTFDGMAIAQAVLQHLVEVKRCKTLFITHYPLVATEMERRFPNGIQNLHMGFTEDTRVNGVREITFLYRLTPGIATGSFGIECARLAGLPEGILGAASSQAEKLRVLVEERNKRNKLRKAGRLLTQCMNGTSPDIAASLQELRITVDSLKSDTVTL
ncbi:DNA mismatch repair protein MSH3 [Dentipellis sp. KUC8613]|nr:DNA mismatch repair protein MSH3 [Dentipellis sp. KUC8613]